MIINVQTKLWMCNLLRIEDFIWPRVEFRPLLLIDPNPVHTIGRLVVLPWYWNTREDRQTAATQKAIKYNKLHSSLSTAVQYTEMAFKLLTCLHSTNILSIFTQTSTLHKSIKSSGQKDTKYFSVNKQYSVEKVRQTIKGNKRQYKFNLIQSESKELKGPLLLSSTPGIHDWPQCLYRPH